MTTGPDGCVALQSSGFLLLECEGKCPSELWMKMADKNKDGMVTKQEFLDSMAKMWDEKHAKMMKSDKDMKAGMMNKTQFMKFTKDLTDPGQIGGN